MSIWQTLGIRPTRDRQTIRRAYAEKTKTCHPEEDPDGFAALHEAYAAAMRYARTAREEDGREQGSSGPDSPNSMLDMPAPGRALNAADSESTAGHPGSEQEPSARDPALLFSDAPDVRPQPPEADPALPQYDFDTLLGNAEARRRQQYENCCRQIMARIDAAIIWPASRYELEDLFDSPEFMWVKNTPLFMRQLAWRLKQGLPAADSPLAGLLLAAYPPHFPPELGGWPAADLYTALCDTLVPLQLEQLRLRAHEAEHARRRFAARVWCVVFCMLTILFFVLGVWLARLSAFCLSALSFGLLCAAGGMARTGQLFGPPGSRRDALLRTLLTLPSSRQLPVWWISGVWLLLIYVSGGIPFLLTLGFYALFAVLGSRRYRALPGALRWAVFAVAAFCVPTLPIFAATHISTASTSGVGCVTQLFIMPLITAILAFLAVPAGKPK